jgi:hypothetical protein
VGADGCELFDPKMGAVSVKGRMSLCLSGGCNGY